MIVYAVVDDARSKDPPTVFRHHADSYAERGSPKYEYAAMHCLERYLTESLPRLQHLAEISDLARLGD